MVEPVVVKSMESALVIEDMQKDFCYEDGALFMGDGVAEIIPRIRELVERALQNKVHVIFAQDWHSPDNIEFELWGEHCVQGTRGAEVIDELSPFLKEAYVVKKERYSDFYETELDAYLKAKGIKRLIIVGVATNICVMHTAIDAELRDYEIIVPEDCVTALSDYEQEYGLRHIQVILKGTISTSDTISFSD
jgi:nicotinamidase/pyrazinamidase